MIRRFTKPTHIPTQEKEFHLPCEVVHECVAVVRAKTPIEAKVMLSEGKFSKMMYPKLDPPTVVVKKGVAKYVGGSPIRPKTSAKPKIFD